MEVPRSKRGQVLSLPNSFFIQPTSKGISLQFNCGAKLDQEDLIAKQTFRPFLLVGESIVVMRKPLV
jgi:hypothetical protein